MKKVSKIKKKNYSIQKKKKKGEINVEDYLQNERLINTLKSCIRKKKFQFLIERMIHSNKKRRKIIEELYFTEKSYLNNLTELKEKFCDPLSKCKSLENESERLFCCVRNLIEFHEDFILKLEEVYENARNRVDLAKIFIEVIEKLKILYPPFAINQLSTKKLLEEHSKTYQDVAKLLDKNFLRFDTLWITPIQR